VVNSVFLHSSIRVDMEKRSPKKVEAELATQQPACTCHCKIGQCQYEMILL
jgi:hypothetical protein